MRKKVFFMLSFLLLSMGYVVAQTTKTTGVVVDDSGQPVIGATVTVVGTEYGTTTDLDGKFVLDIPSNTKKVHVALVGMKPADVKPSARMKVVLGSDDKMLDEVIVTGYGVTRKAAFTGAADVVGTKEVTSKSDPNFIQSMNGTVSGLQVTTNSSAPGAANDITIRGAGSVNANTTPLYVVDGTPMYSDPAFMDNNSDNSFDPMANINPADIQSVTVLKDASATAIYGSRAANGVIVITTKKGDSDKMSINLNVKKGFANVMPIEHAYQPVGLDKWQQVWREGLHNSGQSDDKINKAFEDQYKADGYRGFGTNWLDQIFRTAQIDDYNISFSGKTGTKALTHYYVSGGYSRTQGTILNSDLNRYTGRVNLDTKYKRFTIGANLSGSYTKASVLPSAQVFVNPMVSVYQYDTPDVPVYTADGKYNPNPSENPVGNNDPKTGDLHRQKMVSANINPYFMLDLSKGLFWKTSLGINYFDINQYEYACPLSSDGRPTNGNGQEYNDLNTNIVLTNTLTWLKSFQQKHNLNLMLGQETQSTSEYNENFEAINFPMEDKRDMQNASTPTMAGFNTRYKMLQSFFFNGDYDYASKYYFSASARVDGASVFGANNRWGIFWSVGAKWRLSEEKFFENVKNTINNLTIRASYGTVGNSDIDWYSGRQLYATGSADARYKYVYNGNPGLLPYTVANPDLGWEARNKLNIGLDMSLFKRLSLTVDLYDERTTNMLYPIPLSMTAGVSLPDDGTPTMLENVGVMRNYGIETSVNVNLIHNKNFSWDFNANITANKNEVLHLTSGDLYPTSYQVITEGHSINTFYLKKWGGVDPQTGKPFWLNKEGKHVDYDHAEQQIVGSADPKFYGGFGTTLRYRGFDLSANFNYTYGRKIYNAALKYDMNDGSNFSNVINYVYENRWQKPGDITDVPQFTAGRADNAASASTRFLQDGSYLRMKALTIGYTLPKPLVRKWLLSNIRVFASADNLFQINASKYIGANPDDDGNGIQMWNYPLSRTFTFGLNVKF